MKSEYNIGYGQGASAKESSDLLGVDFVVFAFAAMDRLHVEGMAEDEGDCLLRAEVRKPIPDEHAFDGDDDILPVGFNGLEEGLGGCLQVAV